MKKIIAAVAILGLVAGCSREPDIFIGKETKTFEVIGINQPKHFYVDLKDVNTGQHYNHVYISKHCNDWRKLKMGSKWDLAIVEYERQGERAGQRYKIVSGAKSICDALRKM